MTNVEMLLQSLNKASEKVIKIENTLKKHQNKLEKFMMENGITLDISSIDFINTNQSEFTEILNNLKPHFYDETGNFSQTSWELFCEIEPKLWDVRAAYNKLNDGNKIVENWKTKFNKQIEKENIIEHEAPKVIIDFVNEWGKRAYEWHMNHSRNRMTEDEIIKSIERDKQDKISELTRSVQAITGKILDAKMLKIANNGCLNGVVHGVEGSAHVETILAGGYNIQCLHYRTLINRIN